MSEEFRDKLRRYGEGTLAGDELEEVERELAKMEVYQEFLEGQLEQDGKGGPESAGNGGSPSKDKSIIRRAKWKARITNTLTMLSALLVLTVLSSIMTAVYYGGMGKGEKYQAAAETAVALAYPNVSVHTSANSGAWLNLKLEGKLLKRIGDDYNVAAGDFSMNFRLGLAEFPHLSWSDNRASNQFFFYPDEITKQNAASFTGGRRDSDTWNQLEMLPAGTVAEAYLSLDALHTTDGLLKILEGRNMEPVWFAADTGPETRDNYGGSVTSPLGFPYMPLWQQGDMTETSRTEEKKGWFSKVVSVGSMSPSVESYGDGELRNANFIRNLSLVADNQNIARLVTPFVKWEEALNYVEQHGVMLYGVVVTGPVKELLGLRDEPWISNISVGEVKLWNWKNRISAGE